MNSSRTFHLALMGGAAVTGPDGQAVTGRAAQRHRLALLALLALAPGRRLSREKLIAYLWPETGAESGRNLMNVSVYVLRTVFGEDALRSAGDDLCLNPAVIRSDVTEFEAALDRDDHEGAVARYAGPFLDGFFLDGASEFDRWVEGQRERLRRACGKALERLAERADASGDHAAAAEWWRRLAGEEPYHARVALGLMRALAAGGDRAGAIRHARAHAARLREEIGADADPDVTALAERLRGGAIPDRAPAPPPPPSPVADRRKPLEPSAPPPPPAPTGSPRRRWSAPVVLAALALAVALWAIRPWHAGTGEPAPSVAVLPFVNLSGDESDDYFSDGMTEELIHALTNVEGLRVIARTSAFQFKNQSIDVREVGRRLGVTSVLEGSVRRSGARLRITVQLVSTTEGTHLWSGAYDREPEDVLAVQEEIARSVARTLRPRLRARAAFVERHSDDHEAYHLYLKGRHAAGLHTPGAARQAITYFEQAIARDPDYALAYTGLAAAHASLTDIAGALPGAVLGPIQAAARRALELDSTLAEPRALLGWLYNESWQWAEAEAAFRRALELDPDRPDTYVRYSLYLDNMGRFEEALQACLRARELDPLSPRVAYNVVGSYLHLARFAPAVAEARAMIALHPTLPLGYDALGWALVDSGRPAEAIEPLERAVTLGEGRWLALANLGRAYAFAGRPSEAEAVLARLQRDWGDTGLGNFAMAAVHLALGQRERALARLAQVYRLRNAKLPHVRQWTAFEPLYDDPDFLRIVRDAGF
jgi:serine/threonine-protein kinase